MACLYKRRNTYWISYYLNGQQVKKSLKTAHERVARAKKRQIEYELSLGDLHMASKLPVPVVLEAFCRHLEKTRTAKSYKNDLSRLRAFFGPVCDALKIRPASGSNGHHVWRDKYAGSHVQAELLEDITSEAINRFLSARVEQNAWSAKTVNLMRGVLHRLFAYAIKHHGFRARDRRYPNPVSAVDRRPLSAPQIRFLTLDQIEQQLAVLEDHPTLRAMVAVYIYAGLRREEALWLTRDDVDLQGRVLRIRAKTVGDESWQPKTKRNRNVPISTALLAGLEEYTPSKVAIWFFPSPTGKRWDPDNFSQDLRAINRQHGLPWSCLDFRHTFGSHLAQKGESLYKIATLMGNSPDICRRHYAALIPEAMRDTVEFGAAGSSEDADVKGMLKEVLAELRGKGETGGPHLRLVTDSVSPDQST